MPTRIGKQFRFEAAHRLPLHDGKCRRLHGHSYQAEVTIVGEPQTDGPKSGMILDYGDLSAAWRYHIDKVLDHQNLNDVVPTAHTTAELLARWVYEELDRALYGAVERVRIWETQTSWAEYPA